MSALTLSILGLSAALMAAGRTISRRAARIARSHERHIVISEEPDGTLLLSELTHDQLASLSRHPSRIEWAEMGLVRR